MFRMCSPWEELGREVKSVAAREAIPALCVYHVGYSQIDPQGPTRNWNTTDCCDPGSACSLIVNSRAVAESPPELNAFD